MVKYISRYCDVQTAYSALVDSITLKLQFVTWASAIKPSVTQSQIRSTMNQSYIICPPSFEPEPVTSPRWMTTVTSLIQCTPSPSRRHPLYHPTATTMADMPNIGARRSYDGATCTVRYIGQVTGTSGTWLGVEWDDPGRGRHDGSHKGVQYFTCLSRSTTAASFVRPARPADAPQSFLAALQDKYTAELSGAGAVQFSGSKVAEEVGFDKIRRRQARLSELKFAVLDGARVADDARAEGEAAVAEVCPRVVELDLSRNLLQRVGTVVAICSELESVRSLRLNGNRFEDVLGDEKLEGAEKSLASIRELFLEETLLSWQEICHIATKCGHLSGLSASANQLASLSNVSFSTLVSSLTSLNLEFNEFTAIEDVTSLSGLHSLRNLHLKGNNISAMRRSTPDASTQKLLPSFPTSLQYLDVSYNQVASWAFVDELPSCFPGLVSLRFAHNPIYDNPDPDLSLNSKNVTEEAYMFTVGRLAKIKALNFGAISELDRQNAEMFYLARIGKHLAAVSEAEETEVLQRHRRYSELCELYGAPMVSRTKEINPGFLEARLVNVHFTYRPDRHGTTVDRTTRIPRSFDVYTVKGIAGKLFGIKPLRLRLIWETGEWDPVAGFDDEVEDSSEEDEEGSALAGLGERSQTDSMVGKWVKREVELQNGPRQLGFCVDGLEAKIRVELR
ncbi:RNI-like protein [Xylariaceae sp. FL0804]|nr:RNI-like protein [Xylariaceae sp. FL0804]